ncbi:MAG: hypothetical protein PHO92_05190 [Candidatus Peribacteraceae bacterium]|nr:hypothetical protein [Candidatus Peribacteraceae bacterium]
MAIPHESNVPPPPEVADAGLYEIDECYEIDEHLDYLEVLRRIEETRNRMQGIIAKDTENILRKRQQGTMTDEDYAFWKSIYHTLP